VYHNDRNKSSLNDSSRFLTSGMGLALSLYFDVKEAGWSRPADQERFAGDKKEARTGAGKISVKSTAANHNALIL
jgi:hypothetical protein